MSIEHDKLLSLIWLRQSRVGDLTLCESTTWQVHQRLTRADIARARSVAGSKLVTGNPDTFGREVDYWLGSGNEAGVIFAKPCGNTFDLT